MTGKVSLPKAIIKNIILKFISPIVGLFDFEKIGIDDKFIPVHQTYYLNLMINCSVPDSLYK